MDAPSLNGWAYTQNDPFGGTGRLSIKSIRVTYGQLFNRRYAVAWFTDNGQQNDHGLPHDMYHRVCGMIDYIDMWPNRRYGIYRLELVRSRIHNKVNLRDLIAATGLVIFLKLDSNRRFFSLCDLEIWWMTKKKQYGTSSMLLQALCIIS